MDKSCASEFLLDLYSSPIYFSIILFNCLLAVLSLYFIILAVKHLLSQSIIQSSSRVFLLVSLFYATIHQVSYLAFKILVLHDILFKIDEPCSLYHKSYDCRFITIGQTAGNCGLILIQCTMSLDRIILLLYPISYPKFKYFPGIVFSLIMSIVSFGLFFVLTLDDPLDSKVASCGFYPAKSRDRFKVMLVTFFYTSIINFIVDFFILKWNTRREKFHRSSFIMINRYEAQTSLKSTQALYILSMSHAISMSLYSGLTWLLMQIQSHMSFLVYNIILAVIYASPYACLFLPIIVSITLKRIQKNRSASIASMTTHRENMEDHMKRIQKLWS